MSNGMQQDINDIIEETLHLLDTTEQFKQIKLVRQLHPTLAPITVNKIQIEQVLVNMILNAVDSMQEASSKATVRSIIRHRTTG